MNLQNYCSGSYDPSWSPVGAWPAFGTSLTYSSLTELYVVRPDGTGLRCLTFNGGDSPS